MKFKIIEKFNEIALSYGRYLGTKSSITTINIKINILVYLIMYEYFSFNIFLILIAVLEVLNYLIWTKKIKSGKLEKNLREALEGN